MTDIFNNAINTIREKDRVELFSSCINQLLDENKDANILNKFNNFNLNSFSSGQNIMIFTLAEIVANIDRQSLILFDEPEIHLHPNAISRLVKTLNLILDTYDTYLIFATHSPLIVREVPSRYINICSWVDDLLLVFKPEIEYFGNNLSIINNDLFEVKNYESNFCNILNKISKELELSSINQLFDDKLSFNAISYIATATKDKK